MRAFDLIVRNGTTVRPEGLESLDVGVTDGVIVALEPELSGSATTEVNAHGLHVFPGVIDAHVHFNQPGRTDWEGIRSGSSAFAAGGGTLFVDMPLNSSPVTTTPAAFDAKLEAMNAFSVTDFALWGGLVPGNTAELEGLAQRGVIGFKAFMSQSGLEEFPAADDVTLLDGMRESARLGLPVAVHAESDAITGILSRRLREQGKTGIRDYLASRPVVAELEAMGRAMLFAEETGCALHVVHVSSGVGVALSAEARARGVNVSIETCPHYLTFTESDLERLGAVLKCAPPVRDGLECHRLWDEVLTGRVDIIGSDHSPAPPQMKTSNDFFAIWGGISGVQSTLQVMLTEGHHNRGLPLEVISGLLAANPAQRFRFANKGRLEVGFDADFALVNLGHEFTLQASDLLYTHRQSPYVGRDFKGSVERTLLRGQTVFQHGQVLEFQGRLVKPAPRA